MVAMPVGKHKRGRRGEAAHKTETFGERAKSVRRRRIGVDLVWILFASFRILTTTSAFLFYPVLVSCDPRLCLHTVTRGVCVLPAALLPMACGSPSKSKSIEMKCGEPALQIQRSLLRSPRMSLPFFPFLSRSDSEPMALIESVAERAESVRRRRLGVDLANGQKYVHFSLPTCFGSRGAQLGTSST
uniref:Uncharacterized protein n=1 Tax=Chromera velia CCMP2878 TaxID=1169474 RepID=A0A0G4HX33_9ALVE|eukprot:Cvel_32964.t1-p1 / transcript=Cvel_32964.t1 / gene=Cvel_32964 / organism=Chromera_velia_CCMP2878 / gene_product=hypothetical protein / transcript_product=hypothetical protein / location=Cvel_scaffold5234:1336-4679(+) / protein_length=186 / sequence_SO=supercontig / SO=protein_coding / is_pseudo=false